MKRGKRWILFVFAMLPIAMCSCATYKVVKEEVLPGVKGVVIAAGPSLVAGLLEDLFALIDKPLGLVEDGVNLVAGEAESP